VTASPDRFAFRCTACGAVLRSRPVDTSGVQPAFDVEVAGRPGTRRRVEVPWDEKQRRRLSLWLTVSTALTLALVAALFLLALLAG
jgi:hypothetical protein